MKLSFNSPFARAFVLSAGVALAPLASLAQDNLPEAISETSSMEDMLLHVGTAEENIDSAILIVMENLFRLSRWHISPVEMEPLEEKALEGMRLRINDRAEKLTEAQDALAEAQGELTTLQEQLAALSSNDNADQQERVTLDDQIIESRLNVEHFRKRLTAAEAYQEISTEILIEAGINHAFHALDPHSDFYAPIERAASEGPSDHGIGIGALLTPDGASKYRLENGAIIRSVLDPADNTPAFKAKLQRGDLITHVDGEPLAGMLITDAVDLIKGFPSTFVNLTVVREGEENPLNVRVSRQPFASKNVTYRIVDGDVAYIHINGFMEDTVNEDVAAAIRKVQEALGGVDNVAGYIVSVRDNGGGLVTEAVDLNNVFIDGAEFDRGYGADTPESVLRANTAVTTRDRDGLLDRHYTEPGDLTGGKPLVVLINGGSASASEIFAGTMQEYRGEIVGITSFGKGSFQRFGTASNGFGKEKITLGYYYFGPGDENSPYGKNINNVGIVPDVYTPFVQTYSDSEAGLANTMATPEDAGETTETTFTCDTISGEFNIAQADQSFIDPRTGEYDYQLACGVFTIKYNSPTAESAYGINFKDFVPQP